MTKLFCGTYKDKTVLVTGHTGFKGSWLCLWLKSMGANVIGYSLEAPTTPNHISLLNIDMISIIGDIRDLDRLNTVFKKHKPDIVFHLAAQALVLTSYKNPIETYETNVIGTLKVFEACKNHNVKAIVNITSDKVYQNKEQEIGYTETDTIGGYDPYSSSKACVELLTLSYRNSFFNISEYKKSHNTLIATCRAGNVIGGGDWAKDRLMVDIILAASQNKKISLRNPHSVRPWQHVLEPLSGYLHIGQKLLEENKIFGEAWNFSPPHEQEITVEDLVKNVEKYWNKIDYEINETTQQSHETVLLKLDSSKAQSKLKWHSIWCADKAFQKTIQWYKNFYNKQKNLSEDDLSSYIKDARTKGIIWAS